MGKMRPLSNHLKRAIRLLFVSVVVLAAAASARANAVFVAGNVSGVWSADSVIVADSVFVQPGETLVIEPGVNVYFLDYYKFVVMQDGILSAVGTESEPISFIPFQSGDRSLGLDFIGASNQSILEYCIINNALTSAIHLDNSDITIRNCLLEDNNAPTGSIGGGGIEILNNSNAIIENNIIRNNYSTGEGGGIYIENSSPMIIGNQIVGNLAGYYGSASGGGIACYNGSNPEIRDNIISGNSVNPTGSFTVNKGYGGGISCVGSSNAIISGNIIDANIVDWEPQTETYGGGISIFNSDPVIENNVITNNQAQSNDGGGIYLYGADAILTNNTIAYNMAGDFGGAIYSKYSQPVIVNSILYFNNDSSGNEIYAVGGGVEVSYSDILGGYFGDGNIDIDPLFRNTGSGDFHLMSTECGDPQDSPAIDVGDPTTFDEILDCFNGLGTELSDLGAYGGRGAVTAVDDPGENPIPEQFTLSQNYPNPFNSSTNIAYNLISSTDVNLAIYDVLGRQVQSTDLGRQQPGNHTYTWRADNFPSGTYFYKITAGNQTQTRKMLYLK